MFVRQKPILIEQTVRVEKIDGVGPELPEGLVSGSLVKVLAFDHGYADVECVGKKFNVFMTYLDTGWEYLVDGKRWVGENHSLVSAAKRWERRTAERRFWGTSPAMS